MSRRHRTYTTITDAAVLQDWLDTITKQGYCGFDTETTGLDSQQVDLVGLVFATSTHEACYIPLTHVGADTQLSLPVVIRMIQPVLEDQFIIKFMQNGKYDINVMTRYGVNMRNIEDTMLMSLSMHAGKHRHGMDEMAKIYLKHRTIKFAEVVGRGPNQVTFDYVPLEPATRYAAEDGAITLELARMFQRDMEPKPKKIYTQIELPLMPIVAEMEQTGVMIDAPYFVQLSSKFEGQARDALAKCIEAAGMDFNPGSTQQLGYVLYEKLKLPILERTATGAASTGVAVLEDFEENHTISDDARTVIRSVKEYREARKLQKTYCDALVAKINPHTGRVHPSLMQHGTQTGRLACSEPNLQNVPIRKPAGKLVRKGFIASPGHKLIAADYGQIELRIMAHVADERSMKRAFEQGHDIHAAMAAQIAQKPIDDVDSDERRDAKRANFGIAYGSSAAGIAYTNGIPIEQAERIVEGYFRTFPGVGVYMQMAKTFARNNGYVESLYGRRLWLPGINDNRGTVRRHAERQAINGPIQGTAADIMKFAMIDVAAMLKREGFKTRMLLTVHDELLFEAPDEEVETVMPAIVETMQNAYDLDVPLLVDAKAADNWLDAH